MDKVLKTWLDPEGKPCALVEEPDGGLYRLEGESYRPSVYFLGSDGGKIEVKEDGKEYLTWTAHILALLPEKKP